MVILKDKNMLSDILKIYLNKVQKRIRSKPEITWQYNLDERRPYTREEMLAKKEEIRYPDQIFTTIHTKEHREKVRDFRLNKYDKLKDVIDFTKFETYAREPFDDELISQQDVEFEDVTEEEVTDIED